MPVRPLTPGQQARAAENIPLVRLHLARRVKPYRRNLTKEQMDDLFQHGCLALARAAGAFDPDADVAFAPYALRRIQKAVGGALDEFDDARPPGKRREGGLARPQRAALCFDPPDRRHPSDTRHHPDRPAGACEPRERPTLADLLRRRIFAAGDLAAKLAARAFHGGPEAGRAICRRILDQRVLIPEPSARMSRRRLAADFQTSYSMVVRTEQRIVGLMRDMLLGDRSFRELRAVARAAPHGWSSSIPDLPPSVPDVDASCRASAASCRDN